jgi:hypothetical protein
VGPVGKSGGLSVGKGGESDMKSRYFRSCSPPTVLVKDRWVSPREQVLNILITYWSYGPSKPI